MKEGFSIEENERESNRLYGILDNGVREQLMKYPGVKHVSVGLKFKAGELIWERCFHIYVDTKLVKEDLKPEEIVPPVIAGIKTDVHEIGRGAVALDDECMDVNRYRPIMGGISISNGREYPNNSPAWGTLGVIGRIKGFSRCNTMALTNWHVLYAVYSESSSVQKDDRIFQPEAVTSGNNFVDEAPDPDTKENDIGKIVGGIANTVVDCGVFEINRSCCNCCGVPYSNTIRGLETISPLHFNGVIGSAVARTGDTVYFVGMRSGPSIATVVTDSAPKRITQFNKDIGLPSADPDGKKEIDYTHQIKLMHVDHQPTCNDFVADTTLTYDGPGFSQVVNHGDSGALLLNGINMAVGLVFASDTDEPTTAPLTRFGYANHYHEVIAALNSIGIDFEINVTAPHTGGSRSEIAEDFIEPESEVYREWKKRIESHPTTKAIADAVEKHRTEVMLLINNCRPVTVAWHRAKGPGFAAIIADNIRQGKLSYPAAVHGVGGEELISRMNTVLMVHGSAELKDDLRQFSHAILKAIKDKTEFEEVIKALTKEEAVNMK